MDGVDLTPVWTVIGVIGGFTTLVAGWVWNTRNGLGNKVDTSIDKLRKELCTEISETNKKLEAMALQQERSNTMLEPLWETLCESLPGILKMRNSPDIVDYMLNGDPTEDEISNFADTIKVKLEKAQNDNDDTKAISLLWLMVALKMKKNRLCRGKQLC